MLVAPDAATLKSKLPPTHIEPPTGWPEIDISGVTRILTVLEMLAQPVF